MSDVFDDIFDGVPPRPQTYGDRRFDISWVPPEMAELEQWAIWGVPEEVEVKVPHNAMQPSGRASSTNPNTWATLQIAARAVVSSGARGVGFMLSADDPFTLVDLDHCITSDGVHPAAQKILDDLRRGGYVEVSMSGKGIHAIVKAAYAGDRHSTADTAWAGKFELYSSERFVALTGDIHV
jgi:primase-polymerase (primpol)-like protein